MKSNKATQKAIRHIAEARIKAYNLPDTIEDIFRNAQENNP